MYSSKSDFSLRVLLAGILFVGVYNLLILTYLSPYINPKNFWWISIIGLAYPITSIAAFLILVFCFWKNWALKYTFLFFFVLGIPLHIRYFGWNFSANKEAEKTENTIRLMSYNVRLFDLYEQLGNKMSETKEGIFNIVSDVQPDILCMQEYLSDKSANPHVTEDEIKKLAGFTAKHDNIIWEYRDRYFGIATYSRFPIVASGNLNTEFDDRIFCIYTDHVKDNDTFRVYNLHLQSIKFQQEEYEVFSDSLFGYMDHSKNIKSMINKIRYAYAPRVDQSEAVLKHANESPYPVIICGDFNDTPMSYVYSIFNLDFHDAFRKVSFGVGSTYAGKIPAGRIDYIWHDNRLNTNAFQVVRKVFSDHFPIWADLKLSY